MPSLVLGAILANYQTLGESHGNPLFIANWSEVQVARELQLASEAGAAVLYDRTLKAGRLWH